MEMVSKKLAPILQIGDSHPSADDEGEGKMATDGEATTISDAVAAVPSIEEKMEVREAIRGRKESVIVKGTKVLWGNSSCTIEISLILMSWQPGHFMQYINWMKEQN